MFNLSSNKRLNFDKSEIMTHVFSEFNLNLRSSLKKFSLPESENVQEMKMHLLSLKLDSDEEITKLNSFLQKEIRNILTQIMGNGQLEKVGKLIALLCDVSIEQKYGANQSQKPSIKQSLAITIVEDVLECLGINDLKEILPIITQKICSFKQLDMIDQNRMLKIINHLLKRISKTQDYLIRGQLQFTLTKILPICHDSGFHYRIPIAKGIQIAEDKQAEEEKAAFSSEGVTYQFYKDFWELQKYLMDPNELSSEQTGKITSEQTPKKQSQPLKSEPLISLRLKHMERVLNEVIVYMTKYPCGVSSTSLLNQPIKFLTNTHLLEFQLNDEYFRKIILVQIMVFTFTLKHLKPTGNILKNVMLTEAERQTINKIEIIAQKYLELLQKSYLLRQQQDHENQNSHVSTLDVLKSFFSNELEWLQLKDHWKEKKKVFLRTQPIAIEADLKQKKSKQGTDFNKKILEIHAKIANQMNIQGDTLLKFLTEPTLPHIVTTPTQTSFAYYWSQGKSCLDSFDYENMFENMRQSEFETKSEYNMFEWKALRSLYKQSTKEISLGQKNPKLREYKALALIEKRQKDFKEKLAKSNVQIALTTEQKSVSLPVILQVSQRKQNPKSQESRQSVGEHPAPQTIIADENQEEQDPQSSKKVKID